MQYFSLLFRKMCYNNKASRENGLVAQLGERTVRIREVRGFDPLQVHQDLALFHYRNEAFCFYHIHNLSEKVKYSDFSCLFSRL